METRHKSISSIQIQIWRAQHRNADVNLQHFFALIVPPLSHSISPIRSPTPIVQASEMYGHDAAIARDLHYGNGADVLHTGLPNWLIRGVIKPLWAINVCEFMEPLTKTHGYYWRWRGKKGRRVSRQRFNKVMNFIVLISPCGCTLHWVLASDGGGAPFYAPNGLIKTLLGLWHRARQNFYRQNCCLRYRVLIRLGRGLKNWCVHIVIILFSLFEKNLNKKMS